MRSFSIFIWYYSLYNLERDLNSFRCKRVGYWPMWAAPRANVYLIFSSFWFSTPFLSSATSAPTLQTDGQASLLSQGSLEHHSSFGWPAILLSTQPAPSSKPWISYHYSANSSYTNNVLEICNTISLYVIENSFHFVSKVKKEALCFIVQLPAIFLEERILAPLFFLVIVHYTAWFFCQISIIFISK